jgi:hypothetical protein
MKLLQELMTIADDVVETRGFSELQKKLNEMRKLVHELPLTEGFTDNHRGDLDRKFDEVEAKLLSARRMMSKLAAANLSPQDKNMHRGKILKYINIFKSQLESIMTELGMSDREMKYHLDRLDLDREHGKPAEVFTNRNRDEDKQKFSSMVNAKRNVAPPDEVGEFKQPAKKTGPDHRKWYQRIFGK